MDAAQLNALLMANLPLVLLTMTVLIFIALLVFIAINMKLSRMNKRYKSLMQGMEGANLEALLHGHIEEVRQVSDKVSRLSRQCDELNIISKSAVQRVGVVRFNAFDDTGSDLSFAIALLDGQDNGVVISSLFGRSESRVYAKPVVKAESSYLLTAEEKEALQKAKNSPTQKNI